MNKPKGEWKTWWGLKHTIYKLNGLAVVWLNDGAWYWAIQPLKAGWVAGRADCGWAESPEAAMLQAEAALKNLSDAIRAALGIESGKESK